MSTTIATFKATQFRNESDAKRHAAERGDAYGFCVCNGMFYVGAASELEKAPIIYIRYPDAAAH